jgi:hypothetical protein
MVVIPSIKMEKKVVTISTKTVAEVRIGFTVVVVATMSSCREFFIVGSFFVTCGKEKV